MIYTICSSVIIGHCVCIIIGMYMKLQLCFIWDLHKNIDFPRGSHPFSCDCRRHWKWRLAAWCRGFWEGTLKKEKCWVFRSSVIGRWVIIWCGRCSVRKDVDCFWNVFHILDQDRDSLQHLSHTWFCKYNMQWKYPDFVLRLCNISECKWIVDTRI